MIILHKNNVKMVNKVGSQKSNFIETLLIKKRIVDDNNEPNYSELHSELHSELWYGV